MRNSKGVTIVELLIVIVVMGIISGFAVLMAGNIIENTKLGVDEQAVSTLNTATTYFSFYNEADTIFESSSTDEEKLILLYTEGYVEKRITPQSKNSSFIWDEDNTTWRLSVSGSTVSLSPYGDTFSEITPNLISDMQDKFTSSGSYGRTWGDMRYTDLGLEVEDWNHPILHIIYTPQGSSLKIEPEDGYTFTFNRTSGPLVSMSSSLNYNLIYSDIDGNWYYHTITPANMIDISTLIVNLS